MSSTNSTPPSSRVSSDSPVGADSTCASCNQLVDVIMDTDELLNKVLLLSVVYETIIL